VVIAKLIFRTQTKIKTHMSLFAGKVILITGGTSGIGRATAIAFAEEGASVAVSGRREKEGEESVQLVEKAGGKGLFLKADIAVEAEIEALVARTVEHFGQLNFAFNNAGVALDGGIGIANTAEIFERTMNINVRSVFLGMKYEIPAILKSGGGAIVNNASLLALKPSARSPIYSASKAAVLSLTKSAALEFATRGVRVNAICAAIIETDMTVGIRTDERMRSQLLALHPIGRFGHVEEVSSAVVYLCSPKASFTTGIALPLDGGASA
jgi:NAD(P)-dependent dehydrogenase (short-subunit alcohol dehydrogenase family)